MAACSDCERVFATEKLLARVRKAEVLPEELLGVCPDCRAMRHREKIVSDLVSRGVLPRPDRGQEGPSGADS